jgi:hypothetical protein
MARNCKERMSKHIHNFDAFNEPFDILVTFPNYLSLINIKLHELPLIKPGKFPNNIKKWLWSYVESSGYIEDNKYYLLCKLKNNNYALFVAWTDYSGFYGHNAGMKLYIAKELKNIINFSMSLYVYKLYIKNTIPIVK